jgi:transcriptional regulator GlxA family with amidase domain
LEEPNPGADAVLARYSRRLLAPTLARGARTVDRVHHQVVLLLPRGLCRVEVVPQHLGIDRRTVRRRPAAESSSFSAIVEAVRHESAQRYVEGTARPLLEVAGFGSASAFSRCYRGSFGGSAARHRAAVG